MYHEMTSDRIRKHYDSKVLKNLMITIKAKIKYSIHDIDNTPKIMNLAENIYQRLEKSSNIDEAMVNIYGVLYSYNPESILRLTAILSCIYIHVLEELLCIDLNDAGDSIEYAILDDILGRKHSILTDKILFYLDGEYTSFKHILYRNIDVVRYLESLTKEKTTLASEGLVDYIADTITLYIVSVIVIENENPTPMMKLSNVELRQNRVIRFDNNILTVTSV